MNADDLFMKGHTCYYAGEDKQALAYYNKALALSAPDDSVYWSVLYERGNVKFSLGDYQGAILDFTVFIEKYNDSFSHYFYRGLSKAYLGDEDGAWVDVRKFVDIRFKKTIGGKKITSTR